MWFYTREKEQEIETLTHLETGNQVMRSGDQIWWCGYSSDQPEKKLGQYDDCTAAEEDFWRLLTRLKAGEKVFGP